LSRYSMRRSNEGKNEHAQFVLAIVVTHAVGRCRSMIGPCTVAIAAPKEHAQSDTNRGCRNPLSVARLGTSTKAAPSASPTIQRDGETRYGDRAPQLRHRAQAQYTVRRRAPRSRRLHVRVLDFWQEEGHFSCPPLHERRQLCVDGARGARRMRLSAKRSRAAILRNALIKRHPTLAGCRVA
jgi:hypothetical protein